MSVVEIMIGPPIESGRPQMLLNDDGIWRDILPTPDTLLRETFWRNVEKFLNSAMTSVSAGNPVNAKSQGFQNQCRKFFSDFLPGDLQDALARANADGNGTLRIHLHKSGEWIPWELFHDGTDFLGLRMQVVRLPLMSRTDHIRGVDEKPVRKVFNLLGKDILPDVLLPAWRNTFAGVHQGNGWETRCPDADPAVTFASWDELAAAKQADILHVTCHGGLRDDEKTPYYWSLDVHGDVWQYRIGIEDLQQLWLEEKPLVFGNACSSGAGAATTQGGLHGLGAAFMARGALNFVGTFAPITQQTSTEFPAVFYRNLLSANPRRTVSEALLETKKSFVGNVTDPSYLFYCLYGPPNVRYKAVP
jgi:hypothetical protein